MKIFKAVISVLAAAAMVVAFTACGVGSGAASLQDIYKKLTASDSDYSQWKSSFASTTFEESLNGDSIVVSASGKEGLNGEYTFTLDGDYIVNEAEEGDYSSYSILMMIRSAVADLYGMNSFLMSGYLAGLENFDKENTYLFTEETDGKVITKLYAAGKWKMDGLDEMYVNDKAVQYYDGSSDSYYVNSGKITAAAINSPGHLNVFVGEYGDENTELTLKSVVTLVNKLQPDGFDTFVNDFTEIKEGSGEGYEVYSGIPEDISANDVYDAAEGYSYITVIFDSAASGSGDEDGQNPVMNFIGPYSADRCTVTVAANGMEGAAVSVSWGQSASETVEYSMTGSFDVDTLEITYSDCEKKLVTYDENGDVVSEKVEFTDGAGVIRFNDDGTLTWQDENDAEMLEGMVFTFNG